MWGDDYKRIYCWVKNYKISIFLFNLVEVLG